MSRFLKKSREDPQQRATLDSLKDEVEFADKGQQHQDKGQRLMLAGTEHLLLDMVQVVGHVVELDTLQDKK